MNYYNENDPYAAAWLRQLITERLIPAGDVDDRSITEVQPADLAGYTQCHFFAGIGGWSLALERAGWPVNQPVWTGSCPCQPFSVAGRGGGSSDARHLWPDFARLIGECAPPIVFGEQVASKLGRLWLSAVQADLEGMGYAVGAADLCAAGVGAPHIRQRLWWVADAFSGRRGPRGEFGRLPEVCGGRTDERVPVEGTGAYSAMGHPQHPRLEGHRGLKSEHGASGWQSAERHRATPGFWDNVDWLPCLDDKARPIKSGLSPLVDVVSRGVVPSGDPNDPRYAEETPEGRAMRLRGYGNAIVPEVAATFIRSSAEAINAPV